MILWKCIKKISVPDPWNSETDPDPWISGFLGTDKKKHIFLLRVFCLFLTVGTFTITKVLKDNNSLKSHKTAEIRVSLNLFACRWKDTDTEGPKTYGSYAVGSGTLKKKHLIFLIVKNGDCWPEGSNGEAALVRAVLAPHPGRVDAIHPVALPRSQVKRLLVVLTTATV